ncbi:MAG: hypothetical protein OEU54_16630 [Gemmatimonadota bacterium]|nr:hypothetical protein [Gemmatimonadota bacterium]
MTKKSTGVLAALALMIGLTGVSVTGCGLDTGSTLQPPTDTMNNDPPVENIVPIGDSPIGLESPAR